MVSLLIKEASDEAIYLRKLLQKHKADILNERLSEEEKAKAVDNFIRITNIIYAKLEFVKKYKKTLFMGWLMYIHLLYLKNND